MFLRACPNRLAVLASSIGVGPSSTQQRRPICLAIATSFPVFCDEGRDLRATSDLRALFKGVLGPHLGLAESVLETQVFPDSRKVRALDGLLA